MVRIFQRSVLLILVLTSFLRWASAVANFPKCIAHLKDGATAEITANASQQNTSAILARWGLRDAYGGSPANLKEAIAIDYGVCVEVCGSTQRAFNWSYFSQGFTSWLLPWLALVSQLPFSSRSQIDNLLSVLLTVGSPTLAAYSLAFTVLNSRWISCRFSAINHPKQKTAALMLNCLQQIPLKVSPNSILLDSLITLPQNDGWWGSLRTRLDHEKTWSIATGTGIVWVVVAYGFTLVDAFTAIGKRTDGISNQAVGALWWWLLPIVAGWMIIPVCEGRKLFKAINHANSLAYTATSGGEAGAVALKEVEPCLLKSISDERAIGLSDNQGALHSHEWKNNPIFNYSRLWEWAITADEVYEAFEQASKHPRTLHTSSSGGWMHGEDQPRLSSIKGKRTRPTWGEGALNRAFWASILALSLQWSTTMSAFLVAFLSPTTGLGCRSGGYLLYGIFSTLVWAMLVASSILSHIHSNSVSPIQIIRNLSIFLRRFAVTLAVLNSVLVVAICVLQLSGGLSNCYCLSSVLGRGFKDAFLTVNFPQDSIINKMRAAWSGSIVLGWGYSFFFISFVYLMSDNHNR